jgi:hypothetical protein
MKSLRLALVGLAAVTVFGVTPALGAVDELPDDPKLLKAMVNMYKSSLATKDAEIAKLIEDKNQATSQVAKLKEENARLGLEIAKLKEDNARPVGGEKGTPALTKAIKPDTGKDANSAETKTRVEKAEPKPTTPITQRPTGESPAIKAVKATLRSGLSVSKFQEGPLKGGTAVLVDKSGAYWVSGGTVYAANGFAKMWSPNVSYAPVGIDIDSVSMAVGNP